VSDILVPGSDEWGKVITASKIPAILGISRWQSQFTLWHEMAGLIEREPISEARQDDFDYGHAAELAAAEYWKFKNPGWRLSRGEVQFSRDDLPFPNAATIDRRASRGKRRKVAEVKTARSLEEWGDDGSGDAPADYSAQVIYQQAITGWHDPASIVLWPQYGKPRIYVIEYNAALADHILARAAAWHRSLVNRERPELDDTVSTYECLRRLHPDIDGREVQLDEALALDYTATLAEDKEVTKRLRGLKSRVLDAMGTAETALLYDQKVATRAPHGRGGVALKSNSKFDPALIEGICA
jgi:predicted phage-related endonuclease